MGRVTLQGTNLTYPPNMAFWRWFSFSPGGICWFPGGYENPNLPKTYIHFFFLNIKIWWTGPQTLFLTCLWGDVQLDNISKTENIAPSWNFWRVKHPSGRYRRVSYRDEGGFCKTDTWKKRIVKRVQHEHHGRLTWNLQITHLERKMIFQVPWISGSMLIFQSEDVAVFPGKYQPPQMCFWKGGQQIPHKMTLPKN